MSPWVFPAQNLAVQQIRQHGTGPTFIAAALGGHQLRPDDLTYLHVKNGDSVDHVVTVMVHRSVVGHPVQDAQVTVPAGTERLVGPITPVEFEDGSGVTPGYADVTYDAVTGMTVAALTL